MIFDSPCNWRTLLEWLCGYVNEHQHVQPKFKQQAPLLPSLHLGTLSALLCDDDDAKCENIAAAKRFFAKGAIREGVLRLLKAFDFKFRL